MPSSGNVFSMASQQSIDPYSTETTQPAKTASNAPSSVTRDWRINSEHKIPQRREEKPIISELSDTDHHHSDKQSKKRHASAAKTSSPNSSKAANSNSRAGPSWWQSNKTFGTLALGALGASIGTLAYFAGRGGVHEDHVYTLVDALQASVRSQSVCQTFWDKSNEHQHKVMCAAWKFVDFLDAQLESCEGKLQTLGISELAPLALAAQTQCNLTLRH